MSKDVQKINNTQKGKLDLLNINTSTLTACLSGLVVPRLFYQLVVFVLDASESMTWEGVSGESKGKEIHNQIGPIIKKLAGSKNANSFDVSMYAFSQTHKEFVSMQTPNSIDIENFNFNPCNYVGNHQTYAEPVFLEAEEKINNYLLENKDKNSQAMIVFLGDGDIYDYSKVIDICNRLKSNNKITILSYLMEDRSWSEELEKEKLDRLRNNIKNMSSKDNNGLNFFESKVDPEEIRKHMIKSISTVSKID
ncbi:conserved hypothetical protein [Tenacibaculum dicentrarchi]|uniref:VWFA domain-containing protein n=1 Tax=Tenacibaculum dicentrarchi TaxID=669041 RepID=A0ABM9NV99_9FLAO|nr:conserved hypothetical protein [Tenacibaculum dicentrarchi]